MTRHGYSIQEESIKALFLFLFLLPSIGWGPVRIWSTPSPRGRGTVVGGLTSIPPSEIFFKNTTLATFRKDNAMKYFISQPMNGKTGEEINAKRKEVETAILEQEPDAEILDSFFEGAPHDAKPLWFLGKSLEILSNADIAYFCEGWENARGCKLENECALAYGITVIEELSK